MEALGITGVASISIICYLIGMALKSIGGFDDRRIPVVMGVAGAILGVVSFFCAPGIIPAEDLVTAIAIGVVSGLGATGVNQIYKQSIKEE